MLGSGGPLAPSPRLRAGRHAALGVTLALVLLALAGLARSSAATPGSTLPGVSGSPEITSVSCPTASFCAAAAGSFDLLTSTDPTGGAGAWLRTPTPTGTNARAVSCPDASLCVAVDNNGDVLESTDPTGGTGAWTVTPIGPTDDFMLAVSCSSPSLCVASDDNGNLFVSSNPTGGSSAWTTDHVDGTAFITSVSCVAGPLCVAVDNAGNAISATDPTAGAGAWTATKVAPQTSLSGISCPSETLCVADGFVNGAGGGVVTSTGPTGATGAWQVTQPESSARFPEAVSCLPSGLCAIVDDLGNLLTTTDPTGGAGTWSLVNIDGSTTVDAISCAAGPLCVAADTLGNVLTSTDPAGGAGAWTLAGANATRMLSVSETGNGSGTVSGAGLDCPSTCSTNYTTGSLATLTAVAASGSTFVGWSGGGCSGTGTCVTPVNDDETVVATFVTAPPTAHQLTIDFAGSGHGTVTALGSTCSTDCTLDVPFGEFDPFSLVALTETPAPGSVFGGWTGACNGTAGCTAFVDADETVTATFTPTPAPLGHPPVSNPASPSPAIVATTIIGASATFHLSTAQTAQRLECALVPRPSRAAPTYSTCGHVKTFRHLRSGGYTLFVRAVARDGRRSAAVTHRFTIRS